MRTYALSIQPIVSIPGIPALVKWMPHFHPGQRPHPEQAGILDRIPGTNLIASGDYGDYLVKLTGEDYRGLVCHDFEGVGGDNAIAYVNDMAACVWMADARNGKYQHTVYGVGAPGDWDPFSVDDDPNWLRKDDAYAAARAQHDAFMPIWNELNVILCGTSFGNPAMDWTAAEFTRRIVTVTAEVWQKPIQLFGWPVRNPAWFPGPLTVVPRSLWRDTLVAARDAGGKLLQSVGIWVAPEIANPDWAYQEALDLKL